MDFITGSPHSYHKFNFIWVIVDRVTKSSYFLPIRTIYKVENYASYALKKCYNYMVFQRLLYLIEGTSLHLTSRGPFRRVWG